MKNAKKLRIHSSNYSVMFVAWRSWGTEILVIAYMVIAFCRYHGVQEEIHHQQELGVL